MIFKREIIVLIKQITLKKLLNNNNLFLKFYKAFQ